MSGQYSDQQLVERVQQGDKNAFNLLVLKYQNKVMSLISRYVRNQADVADVTQEA
ncbi:RNA polymerase sigma factor RpoE, partial [Shewanella sp. SG41-4]